MTAVARVEVPVADAIPGDYVQYISLGKPSGQVTRKVVSKVREKNGWAIKVSWGTNKTEVIESKRIKTCYREAEKQVKIVAAQAKEQTFRSGLLDSIKKSWAPKAP